MNYRKRKAPQVYLSRPRPQDQGKFFSQREKELQEREMILAEKEQTLEINRKLLDDTLHEIRKINNEINGGVFNITNAIDSIDIYDEESDKFIHNALKTLDGNSTLLTIRMNEYDLMFNPTSITKELDYMMSVYGKVEKVYKCQYSSKKVKNLVINLNGRSDGKYRLRDSMELAFFIIIENAIKYSPDNEVVDIDFNEDDSKLVVTFRNWAVCPSAHEMELLTERGFRSKAVANNIKYGGSGLGLYLLKQICETNNVEYSFDKLNDTKTLSGEDYHPFRVTLTFRNK